MIDSVADTHAALWYVFGDRRLSASAKAQFEAAVKARRKVAVSVISLAEIVYFVEKGRISASAFGDIREALRNPDHVLFEAPVTAEIIETMQQVSRAEVPDMPDRIVAATAVYFDVAVISRDRRTQATALRTVW